MMWLMSHFHKAPNKEQVPTKKYNIRTNINFARLVRLSTYMDKMMSTLITEFNVESNNVDKVPSRSIKCQYIATQIEALIRIS